MNLIILFTIHVSGFTRHPLKGKILKISSRIFQDFCTCLNQHWASIGTNFKRDLSTELDNWFGFLDFGLCSVD